MSEVIERIEVAENCPGYNIADSGTKSSTYGGHDRNCEDCSHWRDEKCHIKLYDKVLTSLNET